MLTSEDRTIAGREHLPVKMKPLLQSVDKQAIIVVTNEALLIVSRVEEAHICLQVEEEV